MKNNHNDIQVLDGVVIKQYSSNERFSCEVKNNRLFKEKGFRVPEVLRIDSARLEITFEVISGLNSLELSHEEIILCLEELGKIYRCWSNPTTDEEVRDRYVNIVRQNILDYTNEHNFVTDLAVLDQCLITLSSDFRASLFKDAKPTNWIFDSAGVWLIDFDYVKPSFYIADVMQLLNYQELTDKSRYEYIEIFHQFISVPMPRRESILLAGINARIMAMRYNKNLDTYRNDTFIASIKDDLKEIMTI